MTRKGLTMTVAAALAVLPWVAPARAQDPGNPPPHEREFGRGPGGPGGPGFGPHLAEALGLSDAQKTQLEAIHTRQRETLTPLVESARQAHDAFRQAVDADNADAAAVGQAAIAMHAAEKKLQAAHEVAFEELKSILTPDQREKLEKMHAHGPRGGPRGLHGPQSGPQS
jgi:Spy/CpxP family protein refolding chaperone